jgi:CBS domain containing-hemolysin-like protein
LEGAIDEHERGSSSVPFVLDETRVWNIMTPRVDMFAWPATRTLAEIAGELHSVRYSRVPSTATRSTTSREFSTPATRTRR